MSDTPCGKNCLECTHKEVLRCPGCKTGPGKKFGGTCDIARCCRDKGHDVCQTCNLSNTCRIYTNRHKIPEDRLQHIRANQERIDTLRQLTPILGKWMWLLFWLFIPSTVASLMCNDTIAGRFPVLYTPGLILESVCILSHGLILLKLSHFEDYYRKAGIFCVITAILNTLTIFLAENASLVTVIAIPTSIFSILRVYHEYTGHAIVVYHVSEELSDNWLALRKWYMIVLCTALGCIVLALIAAGLAAIILLVASIGAVLLSIYELVTLYNTAQVFRKWNDK